MSSKCKKRGLTILLSIVTFHPIFCCQASDQNFNIGAILTNPPSLTIEYSRLMEVKPVVFSELKEAEKFAELLKSGKTKLGKGSTSCLFYFNRNDKVFWLTNFTGDSVLQAIKAGTIRSAQGCCAQGCWVQMAHAVMVDTNEFNFDSVVSGRNGGFFWNPFRMASEVLRLGMFELVETSAHFNQVTSRWEGKSESGDSVEFSVLPQLSDSAVWIEYSVPSMNIKRHIELYFDKPATFDLEFPSSVVVFTAANGAMSKYCQYDIKSLKLDREISKPDCTLTTILSSSQKLINYNGGKPLFRSASGQISSMKSSGAVENTPSVKVKALLIIFALVSGMVIFLQVRTLNKQK